MPHPNQMKPRPCKHCGVAISWRGDKWREKDPKNENAGYRCANNAGGHRPDNKLRDDQKRQLG